MSKILRLKRKYDERELAIADNWYAIVYRFLKKHPGREFTTGEIAESLGEPINVHVYSGLRKLKATGQVIQTKSKYYSTWRLP